MRRQTGDTVADGIAADGIGRYEKLETLDVGRGSAVSHVHIAAANPARAGRDADLIAPAVIADDGAHRVRAVAVVIAGFGRIGPAGASPAMDRVVPVIVVGGGDAVVAPVLVDQRRMVPIVAGILPGDDDTLAGVAQRPDVVGVDTLYAPLNRLWD